MKNLWGTADVILRIPLIRGAFGVLCFMVVFFVFFVMMGNSPTEFIEVMAPKKAQDWFVWASLLVAAFMAGYFSGWTRTPVALLVLGFALFPVYWFVDFVACGFGESADCKTNTGTLFRAAFYAVGFAAPGLVYKVYGWATSPWSPKVVGSDRERASSDDVDRTPGARPD